VSTGAEAVPGAEEDVKNISEAPIIPFDVEMEDCVQRNMPLEDAETSDLQAKISANGDSLKMLQTAKKMIEKNIASVSDRDKIQELQTELELTTRKMDERVSKWLDLFQKYDQTIRHQLSSRGQQLLRAQKHIRSPIKERYVKPPLKCTIPQNLFCK
jgi:hypothetical protein